LLASQGAWKLFASRLSVLIPLGQLSRSSHRFRRRLATRFDGQRHVTALRMSLCYTLIAEFIMSYREFCRQKGRPISGLRRIDALSRQRKFALSVARAENGTTLVRHSYLISDNRARLLQSVSPFRNCASPSDRNMMGVPTDGCTGATCAH